MKMNAPHKKIIVGGLAIDVLSRREWAERMVDYCAKEGNVVPFLHFSVNGQVLAACASNAEIKKLNDKADGRNADGQPLVIASRFLTSTPLPERVATTDFFHDAAAAAEREGVSFYFLASTRKNIETAVSFIRKRYPKLIIAGYRDGYFAANEEPEIIEEIVNSGADVLWIGMGIPKQLEFAVRNREALAGVKWIKPCGGLFDYLTPRVKRAPLWMQRWGLEWLFRTIQEPRKYFWRYLTTNGIAAWLLLTKTRDSPATKAH